MDGLFFYLLRGQELVLHDLVTSEDPLHSFPPLRAEILVLQPLWEPPPHVLEHDVHDLQALQVQSTEKQQCNFLNKIFFFSPSPGQPSVLQDVVEVDDPEHFCPPLNGPFWVLERVLLPPPHVLEQVSQELQEFQVQSTEKMIL